MCSGNGSFLQLLWDKFFFKNQSWTGKTSLLPQHYSPLYLLLTIPPSSALSWLSSSAVSPTRRCSSGFPCPRDTVQQTQVPVPRDGHLPRHLQISSQKPKSQSLSSIDNPAWPSWLLSRESQSPNLISFSSLLATPSWWLRPASPSFSALVPATPKSFLASLVPAVLTFFSEW